VKSGKSSTIEVPESVMLGPALQRYFYKYLMNQRNLSPRTISAYRDTFKLLIVFFKKRYRRLPDKLRLLDLDSSSILAFLDDLERSRNNGVRSRNARLAAIRSFVRHAAASDPVYLSVAQKVLIIPMKRFERVIVRHLTREQMQLLLNTPGKNRSGFRDRVLLTLLYNTGARVSEIASLKVEDLS
jgi:site-specific recombinase XerD